MSSKPRKVVARARGDSNIRGRTKVRTLLPRLSPLDGKKLDSKESESKEPAILAASSIASVGRILVDPDVVYNFRLQTSNDLTSSVGGTIASYMNFDPSVCTEYSSIAALFNEVRIKTVRIEVIAYNPHSDGYAAGRQNKVLIVACDHGKVSSAPGSADAILDCPNARKMSLGSTRPLEITYHAPKDLNFSSTAVPAAEPYSGCYGEWQFYGGSLTGSTAYAAFFVTWILEFRSRT